MSGYAEYREVNLLWLKAVPAHWEIRRNKNIFTEQKEIVGERSADYTLLSLTLNGIIPRDMDGGGKFPESFDKYKIVKNGDMAFCLFDIDETPRTVGLSGYNGMLTGAYTIMRVSNINARFIYYYYLALDNGKMLRPLYTGLRKTININTFQSTKVPVPPREEQDQIVRFLDWKVSSINKLINIKHKEISELNESLNTKLRNVLLSVPNVKEVPLKRICSVPMTDGPHETPTFVDSGIPFVSAEASHDGRIHLDECRGFITREQHEVYCQKVRPHKNDIFIVKSGSTTGKTVMVDFDEEFSIWSPLALVRCNNLAMPRYVFFYCTSVMFQKQVRDNWSFGTQPNIGMGVLENLRLPLPEIEEQRAIVDTLDAYWSKVLQVKCNLKKQIEEFQSLKTRIIADAVTGKIDVRGIEIPEYEFVDEDADADNEGDGEEDTEEQED